MALHEGAFPSQDRGIVRLARFRRLAALVGASALVLVVAVPGAAAAGPERSPNGTGSSTLLAGEYCSFAVQWDTVKATGQTLVFSVDGNGDQLVRIVGYVETRMTNLDSGASKLYGGGNREDLLFHADGTVSATIDGAVIAAYGVPDVNGPSVWFYRGHLQDEVDNTFTATAHAFVGKAVNVCTDLG